MRLRYIQTAGTSILELARNLVGLHRVIGAIYKNVEISAEINGVTVGTCGLQTEAEIVDTYYLGLIAKQKGAQ